MALSVIIILYVVIGLLSAAGSVFIAKKRALVPGRTKTRS